MKINELKIGDRIKYKKENNGIVEYKTGEIAEFGRGLSCTCCYVWNKPPYQLGVYYSDIICKLEMLPITHHKIRYKEIPIEKEEFISCTKCNKKIPGETDRVAVYTCEECKIKEKINKITHNLCSFVAVATSSEILELTRQLYQVKCKETPIEKQSKEYFQEQAERTQGLINTKSAPKSFKFEIFRMNKFSIDYDSHGFPYGYNKGNGILTIEFHNIKFLDNNSYLCDPNKSYIIEIKEKE